MDETDRLIEQGRRDFVEGRGVPLDALMRDDGTEWRCAGCNGAAPLRFKDWPREHVRWCSGEVSIRAAVVVEDE